MKSSIRKAAVIGSGVMGAAIAAHLANVGIACLLLDLPHPEGRSKRAEDAVQRLLRTNPAPLYREEFAVRITPGNTEDDWHRLSDADWIVEAVVERLDVKRELMQRLEQTAAPHAIISSNTSGISIDAMTEGCGEAFARRVLGTHFFNPPRYMKLLELIPGKATDPELLAYMRRFGERVLGKGVVIAKDTPNFIANRIGTYGLLVTVRQMEKHGLTIDEADAVTGPALGRPKSATFRTLDLVGLDTFLHVADNVSQRVQAESESFAVPDSMLHMAQQGLLGEKAGGGFYRKRKGPEGSLIEAIDLATLQYRPTRKITGASLDAAKAAKGAANRVKALLGGGDTYSRFAWDVIAPVLLYSAEKIGEIADSPEQIDQAMRWGFNWELGPFELWDVLGVRKTVERMKEDGASIPAWVEEMLEGGAESFFPNKEGRVYVPTGSRGYRPVEERAGVASLARLKEAGKVIRGNSGASLIDIGDEVACLEFHSPNNAIGADILSMISQSVDEVSANWRGLVIANEGRNFCVGANLMLLLMEAQDEEWEEVDRIIRLFQNTMTKLKRLDRPVVAAPHRMTLGGGVEVCLPADSVLFAAETYYGLVETGVGLIPAGGGCKELALRISQSLADTPEADLQPRLNQLFETIAMAKVSTSGHDAQRLGYLRPGTDRIVMMEDARISEAKRRVLELELDGYRVQPEERIAVAGEAGRAVLMTGVHAMRYGGYISDHDFLIATKLAFVLTGGCLPAGARVSEQYLLDLEREAFLSLCGEPKTQARMHHMLTKGKPLRN